MPTTIQEIDHRYGDHIHVLNHPFAASLLTELSQARCIQPTLGQLVTYCYSSLLAHVINREFPLCTLKVETRMGKLHPNSPLTDIVCRKDQRVVVVNLARAGTLPSHICYSTLNYILNPEGVRQDHIMAARQVDPLDRVTGSTLGASKIGGTIDQSILLFPDPMGATGATIVTAIDHYKNANLGTPLKWIALHLIVTPEYLRKVSDRTPGLQVYAFRVDRGLSPKEVLQTIPGSQWPHERGLNEKGYIVPGAGGLGEVLNNSFV